MMQRVARVRQRQLSYLSFPVFLREVPFLIRSTTNTWLLKKDTLVFCITAQKTSYIGDKVSGGDLVPPG